MCSVYGCLCSIKIYSMKMTEKYIELGPRCFTLVFALEPSCGGFLSLATATSDARSPFLPANLVYSVVLGLVLDVGPVQVLAQLLLGNSHRLYK